jgi:hypothetical protein
MSPYLLKEKWKKGGREKKMLVTPCHFNKKTEFQALALKQPKITWSSPFKCQDGISLDSFLIVMHRELL